MKDRIREFIHENFLFGADDAALGDDDSFLEQGIIDSTGMLELVAWVQEELGIDVEDDELVPENLDSVNRLDAFIQKKSAAKAG